MIAINKSNKAVDYCRSGLKKSFNFIGTKKYKIDVCDRLSTKYNILALFAVRDFDFLLH